jgi:2-amino-4-hydroxy-6-hydroxymethyldihydropteridine diphosphokinase
MADVFIALGSNLGDPGQNLKDALRRLAGRVAVQRASSLYRTEPVGLREQPHFLNAVVFGSTALEPGALLAFLRGIEEELGRQRDVPLGPRTIDLDLLLYDDRVESGSELSLPHPRMAERRFVLVPLAEIAPDVRLEPAGKSVAELLAALPSTETVERFPVPGWPPVA